MSLTANFRQGEKLLSLAHLGAQLAGASLATRLAACHANNTLFLLAMRSSVAVFHRIGCRKLVPWLLGQPRRMPPSRNQESLWQPYGASLCSVPADLLLPARRRSELCRGASYRPVWAMPPLCPTMRQSSTSRAGAPLSIGWPLRSSDSLCSSRNRSTAVKMSSSSSSASNSDGKGKPKPKSPFHKRGSLQSTTSPGEC